MLKHIRIRSWELGLRFVDGELHDVLAPGRHWTVETACREVRVVDTRDVRFKHPALDVIARSGKLEGLAQVVELGDDQRGLVWVDGRYDRLLQPGIHILWTATRTVRVEVRDATEVLFRHPQAANIFREDGLAVMTQHAVPAEHVGLLYVDERLVDQLAPGPYWTWDRPKEAEIVCVDLRERVTDIASQELMTADRVTLRLNAMITWRVTDPQRSVAAAQDMATGLYREAQLVLRRIVGTLTLDALLERKAGLGDDFASDLHGRAEALGVEVMTFGLRDVILPGDMKALLNRVMEAKTAAEAALLTRREEVAAMRSQANTARLMEQNPTLMRLRELEVLEKVSTGSNLSVVLGERGLADRVVNLL